MRFTNAFQQCVSQCFAIRDMQVVPMHGIAMYYIDDALSQLVFLSEHARPLSETYAFNFMHNSLFTIDTDSPRVKRVAAKRAAQSALKGNVSVAYNHSSAQLSALVERFRIFSWLKFEFTLGFESATTMLRLSFLDCKFTPDGTGKRTMDNKQTDFNGIHFYAKRRSVFISTQASGACK